MRIILKLLLLSSLILIGCEKPPMLIELSIVGEWQDLDSSFQYTFHGDGKLERHSQWPDGSKDWHEEKSVNVFYIVITKDEKHIETYIPLFSPNGDSVRLHGLLGGNLHLIRK